MFENNEIITDINIGDNFISIWGNNGDNSYKLHQIEISLKGDKLDEFKEFISKSPTYEQILQILYSN